MKHILFLLLVLTASLTHAQAEFTSKFSVADLADAPVKLIPFPQEVEWGKGSASFAALKVITDNKLEPSVEKEVEILLSDHGIKKDDKSKTELRFKQNNSLSKEGYALKVNRQFIQIEAATEAGRFFALQSLKQLSTAQQQFQLAEIKDEPAFEYRGFMLDVGRNYLSLEFLKEQLDVMAKYKYNVFQWHLTDRPAWRIESKKYPELTAAENHRQTRDPGKFYTYDEIRELINYANEKQILVIPEIDMPGHSESFVTATGHKMESPEGKKILKEVLQEFFQEIPKEMAPIIHIGSDEVEIPDPEVFMNEMIGFVRENDREVMIWNPGLPADKNVIRQTWRPIGLEKIGYREIDSWNSYINNGEPMIHIPKLFFKPIGTGSENDVRGGILAQWHDVNLEGEETLKEQHPLYPSMLTYAWTTWTADVQNASRDYLTMVPKKGTPENEYFAAFEEYLMAHKERYFQEEPFQYAKQANTVWKLIGPFKETENLTEIKDSYTDTDTVLTWQEATGNTVYIRDRFKLGGQYPNAKPGETYFALTYIHSEEAREVPFWVGFETPYRANRVYTGIAEKGDWDINGGNIWINDVALEAPEWENPGWTPSRITGWGTAEDQETPWEKEELYWTRDVVNIPLKKGWNKVLIKVPGKTDYQNWMFTFAPLDTKGIKFSTSPKSSKN